MIARRIGGTLAGIVTAGLVIFAVEGAGLLLLSGGVAVDPARAALPMLLSVVLAWFLGALGGGLVAARIARWKWAPQIVGAFVLLGILANAMAMPQPLWMTLAGAALAWLAARYAATRAERRTVPA